MEQTKWSIVLAEDEDDYAIVIERALEKAALVPVEIRRARTGTETLALLRDLVPDLLLLDLKMPVMNGVEFLKEIRSDEKLNETIVFVLTTSVREQDKSLAYKYNVAGYMRKTEIPSDFMQAMAMIDHYWKVIEFP